MCLWCNKMITYSIALSVIMASATNPVLKVCPRFFHLLISLCVSFWRSDFSSVPSHQLMLLSVSYLLLTVALSSLFRFSSLLPLFSGWIAFQEPNGVMPDLSLSVRISTFLSSCLCIVLAFLSISDRFSPCILRQQLF